jgi:hypothetical protein
MTGTSHLMPAERAARYQQKHERAERHACKRNSEVRVLCAIDQHAAQRHGKLVGGDQLQAVLEPRRRAVHGDREIAEKQQRVIRYVAREFRGSERLRAARQQHAEGHCQVVGSVT